MKTSSIENRFKTVGILLGAQATGPAGAEAKKDTMSIMSRQEWIAFLNTATKEVFEIMMGAQLECREAGRSVMSRDFTAMIGLAGTLRGVLSLRCSSNVAYSLARLMLAEDTPASEDSVRDAFGELCNMVAGNFKAKIAGMADGCMLSVPTVITGKDLVIYSLSNGESIQLEFLLEGKPLELTLSLHS
jgi:chemotaxis protein CheX